MNPYNRVSLTGNLATAVTGPRGREDEIGETIPVKALLAVEEPGGPTSFIPLTAWREVGESLRTLKKGDRLTCIGALKSHRWVEDDTNRSAVEVVVAGFTPLKPKERVTDKPVKPPTIPQGEEALVLETQQALA